MNVQYFCRFFKSVVGKTPVEYINSYRIEKATELLQTETLSISNIALNVGIDNFSYFIKQFKKHIAEGKKISSSEDGNFNQVIFMERRGKLLKTIFRFKINQ